MCRASSPWSSCAPCDRPQGAAGAVPPRRADLYQGAVIKTHREGLPWFSARRARRRDAAHRKAGGTTSESLDKPPYGSRPLFAGGRQEAQPMRCIARGSLPTRRKADAISMSLYHCSLVLGVALIRIGVGWVAPMSAIGRIAAVVVETARRPNMTLRRHRASCVGGHKGDWRTRQPRFPREWPCWPRQGYENSSGPLPRSRALYQGAVIKTHRDRVRFSPGRKGAAGDAAHRLGFLTPSGDKRTRPVGRLAEALGRRSARLAMRCIAATGAPSREPRQAVSMGLYHCSLVLARDTVA